MTRDERYPGTVSRRRALRGAVTMPTRVLLGVKFLVWPGSSALSSLLAGDQEARASTGVPGSNPVGNSHDSPGPELFVTIWKSAYGETVLAQDMGTVKQRVLSPDEQRAHERSVRREQAFRVGLQGVLSGSPAVLKEELVLVSRLVDFAPSRRLIFGFWKPLADVPQEHLRLALGDMGRSRLAFRRKIAMGLLIIIGMSHYSQPELYRDAGYPGPPEVLRGLWQRGQSAPPQNGRPAHGAVP